jgi:fatty-acyl-CoA synthase
MTEHWSTTVQRMLHREMNRFGRRRCFAWEGGEASYAETLARCTSVASWLQETTAPGARVAIALPNGREFLEAIVACALAGRVRVPLNPKESADTLSEKIRMVDCAVLVTTSTALQRLEQDVVATVGSVVLTDDSDQPSFTDLASRGGGDLSLDASPGDMYRISFTGGTTGSPKAIVQTHRQETAMIRNLLMETIRPDASSVFVAATPLSHASGAFVVPTLLRGGSLAWLDSFDPDRLVDAGWLGEEVAVETFLVPTAMADVTRAAKARGDHQLRTLVYGGAPCPPAVLAEAVEVLGGCLVQVYGQAEAPMTIAVLSREDHNDIEQAAGSVGHPFLYVDVAIVDGAGNRLSPGEVGEVLVAAEHLMSGYWTAQGVVKPEDLDSGWLRTGDLGMLDVAGFLRLVGRSRNMIISGGVNLYPDDIDRRLSGINGVAEVASFGVEHPRWGEALVIAVVPSDATRSAPQTTELVETAARDRLSAYEQPKQVIVVDALPQTDVGKTDKRALVAAHSELFTTAQVR